jgi:O-antigen ligase
MAGLIFGVILFVFLLSAQDNKKFKHSKHLILYFAIPLIVIFAILFIGRIYSLADTDRISLSLKGRMDFWKAGIYAIIKKPLSFLGLGNFGHLYTIYPALSYLKSRMAHNIILQLWVETGPYGVFAFLWFFTVLVRNRLTYILKAKAIDEKFILHMAILSAVSTFLFNNLADFSFFLPQTAIIWWVLSALIAKD